MSKKQKRVLIRILISSVLFAAGEVLIITGSNPFNEASLFAFFLIPYLIVGGDVLLDAIKNIIRGQIFDENFLMALATIGAFAIGEYPEGVAVMLFYQIGELFQSYAVNASRKSIASLMDIRPDYANIEIDGVLKQVDPEEVSVGDIIIVKPGERIPLDGVVKEGTSSVDTSALTGESLPRDLSEGNEALSGCINLNGVLSIQVTKEFGESTVSKILDLVENASSKKAKAENFITKFARYYTPVVVIGAALLAIIPPLLIDGALFSEWIQRALIFLVVSCPCALVISIPLGFFGGIGGASKCGVLIKGSNYLEVLAKTGMVVFDKTGTLTKGNFKVTEIYPAKGATIHKDEILKLAATAESYSDHPISTSLKEAYGIKIDRKQLESVEEISGYGVKAIVDGKRVYVGNAKLMEQCSIDFERKTTPGTLVYVAIENSYAGCIVIADEIKEDSADAVVNLKNAGVKRTIMLTGDSKAVGKMVAEELGLDEVYAELLPADKVNQLEELIKQKRLYGNLAFVGDGINDAPVLAEADVGIAMGGLGSDAAIEAADIVIMDDRPSKIVTAIEISRKTLKIVKQNIILALGIKGIVLLLGAFGMATMWEAVFADVGVSVIAILNAMRALDVSRYQG
ncbi:heavy metal translocating P-type ATPase [Anaerovorax sp. IOR16]|uniref:heavy metal translocating P-type ATPase n=1 Tax=Anaerovorax sp. IOR16 TaxID=2773458 RepID=UPI0019D22707|nr:heavy metal translocating P-type ATPase [Anaerovorax sp. IOR16]